MSDAPRCPIHHDALYRPLGRGDWVCLSRGCRHRVIQPYDDCSTNPEAAAHLERERGQDQDDWLDETLTASELRAEEGGR